MTKYIKSIHPFLFVIVLTYLTLGTLYAWQTPKWQTPDEPAHFNYVRYLAEERCLPVLQPGDYPHQYLEEIKAKKFPPDMSIAPIRYEFHQPPLYYAVAAILYRLTTGLPFDAQFAILRLLSVIFGTGILLSTYSLVRAIFPQAPFLPLAATAFVAVIPMHVAMTAAINNDALAELLVLLILYLSIRTLQEGPTTRRAFLSGLLFGLVLLTKTTVYLLAGSAIAISILWYQEPSPNSLTTGRLSRWCYLLCAFVIAMLFAAPWFIRNAIAYGRLDIFGWQRHDSIVSGQLRTRELLAEIGLRTFIQRFVRTTFNSFWAQFGWMGVPIDDRIYFALALFTALLGIGFCLFAARAEQGKITLTSAQKRALLLLGIVVLLSFLSYIAYNIKFVQHQGRYLFTALSAFSVGAALGLQELLRPSTARLLAKALFLFSSLLCIQGLLSGDMHRWSLLTLLSTSVFFTMAGWLPARWRWIPPLLLYLAFVFLDLLCLFHYIIPALSLP